MHIFANILQIWQLMFHIFDFYSAQLNDLLVIASIKIPTTFVVGISINPNQMILLEVHMIFFHINQMIVLYHPSLCLYIL